MAEPQARDTIHATCIAIGEAGVLLLGPPGSGKSDLALRLIDAPGFATAGHLLTAVLVSDDQTIIERRGDALFGAAPGAIAGRLEIRGLGLVTLPFRREVKIAFAAEHRQSALIERLPASIERYAAAGVSLPLHAIDFLSASAPARLRSALTLTLAAATR